MPPLLPPWPQFSAFLAASFVLAAMPGPGVLFVVARSLSRGRRAGAATVAGMAVGNVVACQVACAGVALFCGHWPGALDAVRWAGGAYLLYLAASALRGTGSPGKPGEDASGGFLRMAGDGCVVALLNPKTYIFMAAFLPQFLGPDGSWPRAAVLGLFGPCFAACTDMGYALAAGSLKGRLDRGFAWTRWIAAPCFAALGAWALLGK